MSLLFVFDMDDVLYRYDWRVRMDGLSHLTGLDFGELRRRWWNAGGEWGAEAGRYADGDAYLAAVTEALGVEVSRDDWVRLRGLAMSPDEGSLAAVAKASQHGRVTLLTNNGPLIEEHLAELAPALVPLFGEEHLFSSSHYGARKPDPVVFERVLEAYGADAADTFFADDLSENVAGARSVGIQAHHFQGAPGLARAIDAFVEERAAVAR